VITLLAGDAAEDGHLMDNIVDFADFGELQRNYEMGTGFFFVDGDFNGNGVVQFDDFGLLQNNYTLNRTLLWILADLNDDYAVNNLDLAILVNNIGMSNPTQDDGDLDNDNDIDNVDIARMFLQYGLGLSVAGDV
jgi:hypothetical protein